MNNKKVIISTIIMVIVLVFLIVGASYAYFTSSVVNDGKTTNANIGTSSASTATLISKDNLSLNLTIEQMMDKGSNVTYYATTTGNPSTAKTDVVIGIASVSGADKMECEYSLALTYSGTNNMITAFSNMADKSDNQIILNVDGVDYDIFKTKPSIINGTIKDLSSSSSKNILASFRIVNRTDKNQTALSGTDITISFNMSKFTCKVVA